ncbi:hypothetical protein OEZ86_002654 [Tetradesmus obliquus]|nr:hypothetical protein OEZ86_002654 [Tetradesmus obliquus]
MAAHRAVALKGLQLLSLASLLLLAYVQLSTAYTDPDQLARFIAVRDAMNTRSPYWRAATSKWTCPTPPGNSDSTCDPCGRETEGNWYHMHCRGQSTGWGESGNGVIDGMVTSSHITSEKVNGPVPKEFCLLNHLREFDFGGREGLGYLTGPIPNWIDNCFPLIEELDLSNNRLTGTLPEYLARMPRLTEAKFEHNNLVGTIPEAYGTMARGVRRFQVDHNHMSGTIPASFARSAQNLTQFHIAGNDFSGNLSMLLAGHLTTVLVQDNPKLCGMVPANVRYAKNYNPSNTNLGKPCPSS